MRRRDYLRGAVGGSVLPLAGCVGSVRDLVRSGPTVDAPATVPVDERFDVRVSGVDDPVWVEARTADGAGHGWVGRALFEPDGAVDLREATPVRGTYERPAGMGLFWSMQPADLDREVYDDDQRTQSVQLRVRPDDPDAAALAATTVDRHLAVPGVRETAVEDPVVGTLVESPTDGPAPGVVLFHGSGGTRPVGPARVLARHGFTVLALQYFSPDHPSLPDALVEVPVEYADRAVEWLRGHESTTPAPVGLGGFSRGGELALLVGTRHEVGAVVNWVGAGLLFNAVVPTDDFGVAETTPDTAAWTIDGDPLAHPSRTDYPPRGDLRERYRVWLEGRTPDRTLRAAQVPLDEVAAPILLVSAGDDGVWPSRYLLSRAENRLEAMEYPYRFDHHSYDGAGHGIRLPWLPTWPNRPSGPFGGTVAGTARAAADAWPRAISFFDRGAGGEAARG